MGVLMRNVYFRGRWFLLAGTEDGALTTERALRTNRTAFAYLTPDGEVWHEGERIGTREDIRFGEVFPMPVWKMPVCLN